MYPLYLIKAGKGKKFGIQIIYQLNCTLWNTWLMFEVNRILGIGTHMELI